MDDNTTLANGTFDYEPNPSSRLPDPDYTTAIIIACAIVGGALLFICCCCICFLICNFMNDTGKRKKPRREKEKPEDLSGVIPPIEYRQGNREVSIIALPLGTFNETNPYDDNDGAYTNGGFQPVYEQKGSYGRRAHYERRAQYEKRVPHAHDRYLRPPVGK